jgi:two-component system cell cycle sensor histidine kinase/response regulator CckA
LNEGTRYDVEYRVVWVDRTVHWIAAKGCADRSAAGEISRIRGVAVDVTARRIATEALLQSQASLSAYFESASQGIVAVDGGDEIRLVNRRAEEMFGYEHDELQGLSPVVLLPERYRVGYAQHRAGFFTEPHARPKGIRQEFAGLRKSGSEFPIEVGVSFVASNSGDMAIGFITDISERKLAEDAQRKTLCELQTLVETCPLAILTIDAEGLVISWNVSAERTFGFSREEVLQRFPPFVPEEGRQDFLDIVSAILRNETIVHCQRVFRSKNGSAVEVEVWGSRRGQTDEGILRGVIVIADLTNRKEMEQRLVQAQKMEAVGRLAGGIAHDFNNLLTVISGYNAMVIEGLNDQTELQEYAEQVQKAAHRASELTSKMLAFSRRQVAQPHVLDLNHTVLQIHQMIRHIIGEEIQFELRLSSEPTEVKADPTQIDQIILNLALNARDAMPNGGTITIETARVEVGESSHPHFTVPSGLYMMLSVTDTGTGIDSETKKHLFEPFFTTKDKDKGTGLGLSIIYGIVEQYGGSVQVSSEPGEGATFQVYLPAARSEEHPAPIPGVPHAPNLTTGRVLLVEDDGVVRNFISEMLRKNGFDVLEAVTPQKALQLAQENASGIDLLLTDVIMPEMRGPALADMIVLLHPETKVIFMSGYSHSASGDALPEGAVYIQKPFSAANLITALRLVLDDNQNTH